MTYEQIILIIYIGYMVLMSIIAFFFFGNDKSLSKKQNVRIKEKTLLSIVAFGGGFGGIFGSSLFKHKTNKIYFTIIIYLSALIQVAVLIALLYVAYII